MAALKQFTVEDVASHNTEDDLYIIIRDKVYDCTKFLQEHPGGEEVMVEVGGKDATEEFDDVGHSEEAIEALDEMLVGTLPSIKPSKEAKSSAPSPPTTSSASGKDTVLYASILIGGLALSAAYKYLPAAYKCLRK